MVARAARVWHVRCWQHSRLEGAITTAPHSAKSQSAEAGLFEQAAHGWRGALLVALIALVSSLFGAADTPVMDVGEAGYAQASRQMAESGDYAHIRLQDAERHVAPPGIYWLQATAARLTEPLAHRDNAIWPYRLPSAFGIVLAALAALWGGRALTGEREALLGAILFAASAMAGFAGMLATPDALTTGFTTWALAALARLCANAAHPQRSSAVFWIALAGGLLAGGFVVLLVSGLCLATIALWERRAQWMTPLLWWPGPLLALVLLAPWLLNPSSQAHFIEQFGGVLAPALKTQTNTQTSVLGYHLFLLPFLIFPACYALPAATRLAWETVRAPVRDAAHAPLRFLIAWAAPLFLFCEIAPNKLPHLVLPAYPAVALLCGAGIAALGRRRWRSAHPAGLVLFAVAGAILVAATATGATLMPGDLGADIRRAISAALVGVGIVGLSLAALLMLRHPASRALVLAACALMLSFSLRERLLPEVREMHVSNEALAALTRARLTPRDNRPLWVVGYDEASLVFLTRTSIRLADAATAAAGARKGDALVVEARAREDFERDLHARGLYFKVAEAPATGLALARGERVQLFVGAVSDAPADAPPRNP